MRGIILVALFVITTLNLFGQSLHLLNKDRVWSTLRISWQTEKGILYTDFIKFNGDTIIQSQTYTKVLQSMDSLKSSWNAIGFVREEQQTGLFFRNIEGREELLYDYNLQVADTFIIANTQFIFDTVFFIVEGIDSVLINDSLKRRILLSRWGNSIFIETWIEDIGSLTGILYDRAFASGNSWNLLCCYENDVLLYKNSSYDNCYYFTPTEINDYHKVSFQFNLFPNPVTGSSEIKINGLKQQATLIIYNSNGAKVLDESIVTSSYSRLVTNNDLPAGFYIVTLNVNRTTTQTLKMVVVK